jgi:hypothetical protein
METKASPYHADDSIENIQKVVMCIGGRMKTMNSGALLTCAQRIVGFLEMC